ncbi:hypothetical protein [Sphingobacterium faecium]
MWYFILALLFGNPSNSNTSNDQTMFSIQTDDNDGDGNGGDRNPIRPGK